MGRILCLCTVLLLACSVLPAAAAQVIPARDICFGCDDHSIYGLTNLIAYLEANPNVDDANRGPIITWAQAKLLRLRAAFGPRPQWSLVPCCYRRRPIYIR